MESTDDVGPNNKLHKIVKCFEAAPRLLFSSLFLALAFSLLTTTDAIAWDKQASMKRARSESSAVMHNNEIYVFNGFGPRIDIENSVEKYNPNSKTWSVVSTTSVATGNAVTHNGICLLYTSPSPRDATLSRMPSSA